MTLQQLINQLNRLAMENPARLDYEVEAGFGLTPGCRFDTTVFEKTNGHDTNAVVLFGF